MMLGMKKVPVARRGRIGVSYPIAKARGFATHPCGWRLLGPAYTLRVWPKLDLAVRRRFGRCKPLAPGGVPLSDRAWRSVGLFQHGFTVPTRHPVAKADSNGTLVPGIKRDFKRRSL
jgi:hypothetical protein